MSYEDLINSLNDGSNCKDADFLTSISDKWKELFGGGFSDTCELLRYIRNKSQDGDVDEALIISTIYYGYNTKPTPEQYENPSGVSDNETTASEHYKMLIEILTDEDNHITRSTIDKIIKYSKAQTKEYYFLWVIDEVKDSNDKVTSITAKCERKEKEQTVYAIDKWRVFMRFGETAADAFDGAVLKSKSFLESSDECKNTDGAYTNEKLTEQVAAVASSYEGSVSYSIDFSSVEAARKDLESVDASTSEAFYQAADVNTKTRDMFSSYNGITFDYTKGFAYINFPGFKPAIDDSSINIHYDAVFTPKEVEQVIQDIVDKKADINSALLRPDPDDSDYIYSGYQSYGSSGVTGAKCMPYLTASLNEITVKLTDCYGKPMAETTFEDYIMGVANGEVSNSHDQYVLSQMVAAISYALARRGNWSKGKVITLKSGTCDQVYCNMKIGCYGVNTPVGTCDICNSYYQGGSRGKNPNLYSKYQALYAIASNYLVVKDDKVFSAHYVSTIQNGWYKKAVEGKAFPQIIQEEYEDEGAHVIKCSDSIDVTPPEDLPPEDDNPVGNKPTDAYPEVSEDMGSFYGFAYKLLEDGIRVEIIPEWKNANLVTISPKCNGNEEFSKKQFIVHKKAQKYFEKAFEGVCKLLTDGVKLSDESTCKYTMEDLTDGTVFTEKKTPSGVFDLHAYGLAQDWNYSQTYTINGKEYKPYNTYDLSDYKEFVNALGKEEDCRNVNYILWIKAYKDAGFNWGGNVSSSETSSYNGKLFELVYK